MTEFDEFEDVVLFLWGKLLCEMCDLFYCFVFGGLLGEDAGSTEDGFGWEFECMSNLFQDCFVIVFSFSVFIVANNLTTYVCVAG